ncbi:MAG TPA: hypothetical protein VIF15_13270 [Polyangiaceae bacterium]|jgi:GTP cyclohydrolase III
MLPVRITVAVGTRVVPVDEVTDARIAHAFRNAGQDVARRLAAIHCPEHKKTATNVRIHFDKTGSADLRYDSCCEKLGKKIGEALG